MMSASTRKTHTMVLIAATALTLFSILGSAMITGLVPSAHSAKTGYLSSEGLYSVNPIEKSNSVEQQDTNAASGKITQTVQHEKVGG